MRLILAALTFALAACAAPFAHADDIAYDPAPLERCMVSAGANGPALEACRGIAATACIATEGDSTMAMTLCWDREAQTWSGAVDATVERLASAAPTHAEALRTSQAAWAQWADTECSYRADLYEGGSGAQVEHVTCAAGLAADRVLSLRRTEAER